MLKLYEFLIIEKLNKKSENQKPRVYDEDWDFFKNDVSTHLVPQKTMENSLFMGGRHHEHHDLAQPC